MRRKGGREDRCKRRHRAVHKPRKSGLHDAQNEVFIIASKLIQHVAKAHAYGQILLGMDRPSADVSRGANAHDVLGVAAIVGLQSISYDELYPPDAAQTDLPLK